MKNLLVSVMILFSASTFAEVGTTTEKLEYSKEALSTVLEQRGLLLNVDSISISTSFHGFQIAIQTKNLIFRALPLGNTDSDFDVVRFEATNLDGDLFEGWIHLFSTSANGCVNDCRHQLDSPTAKEIISTTSGETVYFRLYNPSLPQEIEEMDLHLNRI